MEDLWFKLNENTLLLQSRHRQLFRDLLFVGFTTLTGGIGGGYGTPSGKNDLKAMEKAKTKTLKGRLWPSPQTEKKNGNMGGMSEGMKRE